MTERPVWMILGSINIILVAALRERVLNKNQDVIEIYYLPNSPWISLWFLKFASHASWVFHIGGTGGKKKALISIMASLRSPCHTFPLACPNQLFCGKHGHGMTTLRWVAWDVTFYLLCDTRGN